MASASGSTTWQAWPSEAAISASRSGGAERGLELAVKMVWEA